MIFKILKKIYEILFMNYIKSTVSYSCKRAKNSFIAETGTKIYNPNVTVGNNVRLYHNVIIFGDGPVTIDDGSKIGYNTIIYSSKNGGVHIGKNCAIAANAYIIDTNHSTKIIDSYILKENDQSEELLIGNNVWIAAQCVIAKGSKLGNNVVVGANSFVNKPFPDKAIIAGSPAKIIKYRGE